MTCPKCGLRALRPQNHRPQIPVPRRRAFHTSPRHQRLGANTYAQEWNTGVYHYNKATSKNVPVALAHADELLTIYATQQRRRADPSNPLYAQITRNAITGQRRSEDRVFISRPTIKDFGNRIEVGAYLYDHGEVNAKEREKERLKKMGVKPDGQRRKPGAKRRGPALARTTPGRVGGGVGGVRGPPGRFGGPAGNRRPAGFGRPPGATGRPAGATGRPGGSGDRSGPPRRGAESGARRDGDGGGMKMGSVPGIKRLNLGPSNGPPKRD